MTTVVDEQYAPQRESQDPSGLFQLPDLAETSTEEQHQEQVPDDEGNNENDTADFDDEQQHLSQNSITVPNSQVGAIIGRGGNVIRHIRKITGADVVVQSNKDKQGNLDKDSDRLVTVTGLPDAVGQACNIITEILASGSSKDFLSGAGGSSSASGPTQKYVHVPTTCVGAVIGKDGGCIKNIRELSNCNVLVERTDDSNQNMDTRLVTLTGLPHEVQLAHALINLVVQHTIAKYEYKVAQEEAAQAAAALNAAATENATEDAPFISKEIVSVNKQVPEAQVGGLIGKGGSVLKALRQMSGCKLLVESTDNARPDPELRNMTIEGPSNRVQLVKQVIDYKIIEIQKREYKPRHKSRQHQQVPVSQYGGGY